MSVYLMKLIITSVLALYGLTPFWCDSCGETYLYSNMIVCDNCGAHICETCAELYDGDGCFVCNGEHGIIGHDSSEDVEPVTLDELF